ncbi:lipid II flippase MurJ [uncultured Bifidobacterium sp.]|uniref:murein biosynthesis integral membrane protein MurJ n=1 Tax=uncultured Bifidobacterium sp. TaxID=165187 RepID=UPI002614AAD5|nr:lipid II flippase MurJ [uncultured Bifidobacterium sp.]
MSSATSRNSMIMAVGTAASRVTGQVRSILLAAAIGTTGMAANAYQAGAMIPQVIFTLVSGGIFNAVLVPQIVRTLQSKDAEKQLNKLITFALLLLLSITLVMMSATPLLTWLYTDGDNDMRALTNAFTLWCMPQILFYGLYTVLGQILAAKNRFGAYAWSSVGANLISSIGFTAFILLFGKANNQPLQFWTTGRVALTAGAWTLGVAFQALILFFPLARSGIKYRPRLGIRGIGLRSMGPVAAWSLGIVIVGQLVTIIDTRVTTSAPTIAARIHGASQLTVAGNASYQNAYTLWILPYSLIAVSVSTAVFPVISRYVARKDLKSARLEISQSLRDVGLMMCFFAAALVVMAAPIAKSLLPSISTQEALLMASPLAALALCLPLSSAYLIIQRSFFAFEDGRSPFIFAVLQEAIHLLVLLIGIRLLPPEHWATLLGLAVTLSTVIAFPALLLMLRRRLGGSIDGHRLARCYCQGFVAAFIATVVGLLVRPSVYGLVGATWSSMAWIQAVAICVALTAVILIVYLYALRIMHSHELALTWMRVSNRFPFLDLESPAAKREHGLWPTRGIRHFDPVRNRRVRNGEKPSHNAPNGQGNS